MRDSQTFDTGLQITHETFDESAIVHVSGPLQFPDAVALSRHMNRVIERRPPVVLFDLTHMTEVDSTGVAVLVGVGGDLKQAGIQVRVVASDPRIRHRLPYTLGLRKVFPSLTEALRDQPQRQN